MLLFMRKTVIVLFLLTCTSLMLTAQNDWKTGFIIQNNGDTIQGYLDNRDSKSNAQKCYFKSNLEETTQEFSPSDLKGYRYIDGKFYISKTVKEIDPTQPVFLEFIIQAEASLYHFRDKESHYFIEKDSMLYPLVNTKSIKKENSVTYEKENNEYIGVLNYLLRDADISSDIQRSELTSKSLTHLANKYHHVVCSEKECIIYERKPNKVEWHVGVFGESAYSNLNFGNRLITDDRFAYAAGIKIDMDHVINWMENLFLSTGFELQQLSTYEFSTPPSSSDYKIIEYDGEKYYLSSSSTVYNGVESMEANINTLFAKIPVSINYYLNKGNFKPYIGAGVLTMFTLSQNDDFRYTFFYDEFGQSIPNFHMGFRLNAGLKIKVNNKSNLFTECTFEKTQTSNINQFYRFHTEGFSLKVGYMW